MVGADSTFWTQVRGYSTKYYLKYDVWSNVHFGYVGTDIGFMAAELRFWGTNKNNRGWRSDLGAINVGIDLWHKWRRAITMDRLNLAIRSKMSTWLGFGDGGVLYRPFTVL